MSGLGREEPPEIGWRCIPLGVPLVGVSVVHSDELALLFAGGLVVRIGAVNGDNYGDGPAKLDIRLLKPVTGAS